MKDCILSNIWIKWRFDGPGDSHKAPELSGISTLEFLRNWWAERLLRFRFVTEQKRGWQGGNVPSNRFCSQRTQRDAVGCCWNVVGSDRSCSLSSILPWEVCDCSRVGPSTNGMCSWRTNSGWQKSERKHSGVPGYTLGLLHWPALDRGQMAPGLGQAQTHCFVQHRHWARLIEQTAAQKEMNWNNSYTECVFKMVDTIEAILPRDTGWYSPLTKLNILRKYRR